MKQPDSKREALKYGRTTDRAREEAAEEDVDR